MSDNLLKIENPEQEGYIVREENGIKYIEKKELINHEKHGECISFFKQEIKVDENNNTIVAQRNNLYTNNPESTIIEANIVTFENEEFKDKTIEKYTNGQLTETVINDKKTEKTIKYYEDEKEGLVKEIDILDLSHNLYIYRSEQDKKGNVTFQLNSEKIIENKGGEYPLEYIYNIKSNGEYTKTIYLKNDKFTIRKNFNSKGDLINIETTDKEKDIVTKDYYTNGKLTQKVVNDKKIETTIKYYEDEKEELVKTIDILDLSHNLYIYRSEQDKKGNVIFQLNSEKIIEHKGGEYPLEHIYNIKSNGEYTKTIYLKNDKFRIRKNFNSKGDLINIETTDKEKDIVTKDYYTNGKLTQKVVNDKKRGIITTECKTIIGYPMVIVEDKNSNITIKTVYDQSGNIDSITEENKNTGIEIVRYYDKSSNIDSIKEENKNTGIEIYTSYDESGNKTSIREENKNTGIEIYTRYDKLGNTTCILEENKSTGVKIYISYYAESDNIEYIKEKNKNTGIENTTYYYKSGTKKSIKEESEEYIIDTYYDEYEREKKYSKENKKTGIKNTKEYDEFGKIKSISEENKEKGISKKTEYYETGKIKSISEENKETGISKKTLNDESEKIKTISIKNEKTGITNTKEYKESGNEIILYHKDKTIIEKYRIDNSLSRRVTMTDKERIVMNFDMSGAFKNISRNTKNSDIGIEEYFEKGKLFPVFKVNDIEIPLVSLDKYKEVCQKYNIEPLPEVLAGQQPPKPPAQPKIEIF